MSLIAGLLSKKGDNVTPYIIKMLQYSSPIKADSYGVASPDFVETDIGIQKFTNLKSEIAVAQKLVKTVPLDNAQPIQQNNNAATILGRFWDLEDSEIISFSEVVRNNIKAGLEKILREFDGTYSIIATEKDKLICCKDYIDNVPLYFAENDYLIGAATNMKMLRIIGLEPISSKPGTMIQLTKLGIKESTIRKIDNIKPIKQNYDLIKNRVKVLLQSAIEKRSKNIFEPAIAFSGGLDSSLLAYLFKNIRVNPILFCVGMEGSLDITIAEETAESLNLPIKIKSITLEDLSENLPKIIRSVEVPEFLQIGVAAPLYWASSEAYSRNYKIIISGNGCDEIFAGYAKYSKDYAESEVKVLDSLNHDIKNSYKNNFERDWKICTDNGVELRLSYTDHDLIDYTRTISIEYLISPTDSNLRKKILRYIAKELGLSHEVSLRPKKAAQYSSGIAKGIQKLAKENGLTIQGYISKFFTNKV